MRGLIKRLSILISVLVVILGLSSCGNNKESIKTPVRDVEVKDKEINYESIFAEYDHVEEKIIDGLYCIKADKKYSKNDFDELDLCGESTFSDLEVEYQVGYDYIHKKVMISVVTHSEDHQVVELPLLIGDVFEDEDGNIDAEFTDEDGTFYLSDMSEYAVENCSWLTKKLKKVAAVVGVTAAVVIGVTASVPVLVTATVVYVGSVVAIAVLNNEEAKQHQQAFDNYEYNKNLVYPTNKNTTNNNDILYGYITNQHDAVFKNWKMGSKSNLYDTGCEIIASYNAMKMIGKEDTLAKTTYDIECLDILFLANGEYGANPYDLGTYYKKRGADYTYTTNTLEYYGNMNNKDNVVSVVSYANKNFFNNGLHTFVISKYDGVYYSYNDDPYNNYLIIDDIFSFGDDYSSFLCSYIFKEKLV